jgi:HemY protein
MKNGLFFFISLVLTVIAVFGVKQWLGGFEHPGYVLIGIGNWSMETSLIVFLVGLILLFYVAYLFFSIDGLVAPFALAAQKSK